MIRSPRSSVRRIVLAAAGAAVAAGPALAAGVPSGFVDTPVASGLSNPTAMAFAPDGRLFVCQQGGALRVIEDGVLLTTPFVTLTVDSSGERGLLGVAFDPAFAANSYVYVYYTATSPSTHNRISRFTANGNVAVPASEQVLMDLDNLSGATNHNGGAIHFGADGKLYAAVGENANGANSQTLANRLGKVLRINSDGSIPSDNPFFGTATGDNRSIWVLGLRNPFTFAFDPTTPGRIHINDVGQSTWEEIDDGIAGSNYGWPNAEGFGGAPTYTDPLLAYPHSGATNSSGCAIVGAAFYDPSVSRYPADFAGDYLYGDLCNGWVRRFDRALASDTLFLTGISSLVDLAFGPSGDLHYLARGSGGLVSRISTDVIFDDGFESGDLSAWSPFSETGGGDLSVSGAAALASTASGLQAFVDDTAPLFVRDDTPHEERRYRARFYFDPNGFDPGEAQGHRRVRLLVGFDDQPVKRHLALVLRRVGGAYGLMGRVRLDDNSQADTGFFAIDDGPHLIEIDWQRSGGPSANDGSFELWIDEVSVAALTGLDASQRSVDLVRLGPQSLKGGAGGTLYFDQFRSRRLSMIGPE
jgi:glucose/arabinose dehydrogenase